MRRHPLASRDLYSWPGLDELTGLGTESWPTPRWISS